MGLILFTLGAVTVMALVLIQAEKNTKYKNSEIERNFSKAIDLYHAARDIESIGEASQYIDKTFISNIETRDLLYFKAGLTAEQIDKIREMLIDLNVKADALNAKEDLIYEDD